MLVNCENIDELKRNDFIRSLIGDVGIVKFDIDISTIYYALVKSNSVEEFFNVLKESLDEPHRHDFELIYEPNNWSIIEFNKMK